MEEDKNIKRKKALKKLSKCILWIIITFLIIVIFGLVFLYINAMLSDKQNSTPYIGLYTVTNETMEPQIKAYDVVLTLKTSIKNLKKDDIVTYYSLNIFDGFTILTNKVIKVNEDNTIEVKGNSEDDVSETVVQPNVIGKVILVIPQVGNMESFLSSKTAWLKLLAIPLLVVVIYDIYKFGKVISMKKRMEAIQNEHGNI